MPILFAGVAVLVAYLFGSLPIGVIVARLIAGIEVRHVGSGRTGTTNVYRAVGPWGAALTVLGDVFKGVIAVWLARVLMACSLPANSTLGPWVESLAGVAAIAGHNWSVFLNFKGGAGAVTTLGILGTMNLHVGMALVALAVAVLIISRTASIASMTVAIAMSIALAISAAIGASPWAYVFFGIGGGLLILYALRPNIRRLKAGQERKLGTTK